MAEESDATATEDGAGSDDKTEEKGPPTIEDALAQARATLEKKGTMMAMVDDDKTGDDEGDADGEKEGEGGEEDEEEEAGEEEGDKDAEGDEDEEDGGTDADDDADEVEGEEEDEKEDEDADDKKSHTVKLPSREADGEDFEIEVDDEETAERLNQMRNGFMRGEEHREKETNLQVRENELAGISESFEVDPAGFLMEYVDTKDLPQFFRGSQLEKLLTTFQNQINQNGNFYAHDIIGARKAGEIGNKVMAHRIMFSYIMPAMLFGMIGRARLPLSWRDVLTDLATYPIAPLLVVGRWIDRMIRGWGQSGTVAESGPESLIKAVESAKKGDFKGIMFNSAKAVGAFTGRIPAQAIRTTEGALDLLAGSTQDPRRLIYSKWALEQGKQKEQTSGRRRAKRKRPSRRSRRSR